MSTKLSSEAPPFVPGGSTSSAPNASLRAAAAPFMPSKSTTAMNVAARVTGAAAPAPVASTLKPFLNASAAPYCPTRTSPTAKGTPAFPAAATTAAPAATAAPVKAPAAIGQSPAPVSPVSADGVSSTGATNSSSSAEASVFAVSSLVPKTPKRAPANSMDVPKFSHSWGLICNNHLDPKNYTGVEIRRAGDIEAFWRLWHHVPLFSSKVSTSAGSAYTYHWFKGTIKPSWEDRANANGGILTIPMLTADRVSYLEAKGRTIIDDIYITLLMFATGAAHPTSANVNGITIKSRNGVAIDLWLDTTDAEKIKALVAAVRAVIAPIDNKYEKEKFAYMSTAQRVAAPAPSTSSGYKAKAAKVEKKIDYY